MSIGNHPPPIINKQKPENAHQQFLREQKPSQTAWLTVFKRIIQTPNTRYVFLWLTGGILFCLFGKKAIQRREEELLTNDIENYLKNKRKKDLE